MRDPLLCESCGHRHLASNLGAMCVGCPCDRRPATVYVWCRKCGDVRLANATVAFREGWPLHCGETMTLDKPEHAA